MLLGTEKAPRADKEIDKIKADGSYETESERKEKKDSGRQMTMHT